MSELLHTERSDRRVTARLRVSRYSIVQLDELFREVRSLLCAPDVSSVVLDLQSVDFIDNSFVNTIRALSYEARKRRTLLRLESIPMALRAILTAPSHRLAWAAGLLPHEEAFSVGGVRDRRRRVSGGWRHVA